MRNSTVRRGLRIAGGLALGALGLFGVVRAAEPGAGAAPRTCWTGVVSDGRGTVPAPLAGVLRTIDALEFRATDPDSEAAAYAVAAVVPAGPELRTGAERAAAFAAVESGLRAMREGLVGGLGLTAPARPRVAVLALPPGIDGFVAPGPSGDVLVIDAGGDADAIRRRAAHQYAHAVASAQRRPVPGPWAEAFATWATARTLGLDDRTAALYAARRDRMGQGLLADDPGLSAGNGLWFAFVAEAYGDVAVRLTLDELGSRPPAVALDRALRRAAGVGLDDALGQFQIWSLLTGSRSDGLHFRFAERLPDPTFASSADWLPALSVQSDPPVAALGTGQVRIVPDRTDGGMTVRFEGEFGARWSARLLIFPATGDPHLVDLAPGPEGRGELTVPLDRVREAIVLIRNLDREERAPRRYTWSAQPARGFPFELASIEARAADGGGGIAVSWETASEQPMVGFNVLRTPARGGRTVRVNPVWVPAIGDPGSSASYRFLDADARPGVPYVYRVEAVTFEGLTSLSEGVAAELPAD